MPTVLRDRKGTSADPDDTGGRPRVDPRIKARRDEVTEGHRHRRRRRILVVLGLVALLAVGYAVFRSHLISVRDLDVAGATHTTGDDIRGASGVQLGDRMFDVDVDEVTRRVEALPWVASARVERRWPGTVTVEVTERVPAGVVPDGAGGWLVIDGTGRVLGPTPPVPPEFGVHIEGLAPVAPGKTLDPKVLGALAVAKRITPGLGGRVATLRVTEQGTVDVKLRPRGTVWLGRPDDATEQKVDALRTVLAQVDLRDLCRLDLRVPDSPVLTRDPQCA